MYDLTSLAEEYFVHSPSSVVLVLYAMQRQRRYHPTPQNADVLGLGTIFPTKP